jgi:hypothetical protein
MTQRPTFNEARRVVARLCTVNYKVVADAGHTTALGTLSRELGVAGTVVTAGEEDDTMAADTAAAADDGDGDGGGGGGGGSRVGLGGAADGLTDEQHARLSALNQRAAAAAAAAGAAGGAISRLGLDGEDAGEEGDGEGEGGAGQRPTLSKKEKEKMKKARAKERQKTAAAAGATEEEQAPLPPPLPTPSKVASSSPGVGGNSAATGAKVGGKAAALLAKSKQTDSNKRSEMVGGFPGDAATLYC